MMDEREILTREAIADYGAYGLLSGVCLGVGMGSIGILLAVEAPVWMVFATPGMCAATATWLHIKSMRSRSLLATAIRTPSP